ncbi:MAG: hypothetical protein JXA73_09760 [Acidobacteria bacterium]|nr:hypothetical protein [Acidobacteriota bacterium]
MSIDAVVKIGGSLCRSGGLKLLCREIRRMGERYHLLVVPGGGEFADQVREMYRRFRLEETTAHYMALLAMDQFGYMLHELIPGSHVTADLPSACHAAESGTTAVLLPSAMVMRSDPLPHSWQITSDTISAWITEQAHCPRLILLKSVDGLIAAKGRRNSGSLIAELTAQQLSKHGGEVDAYLSQFLQSRCHETWVINGRHPERLSELLSTGYTTGTRIRCN